MSYDYIVKIGADVSGIASEITAQLKKSDNAKIKIQCDDSAVQKVITELSHLDKKTANRIKIDIDNTGVYKSLTQIREFAHNEVTRIQNEISSINFGELQSKLAESEKQLADAIKKSERAKSSVSKDVYSKGINDLYKQMEKTPSSSGQYAKMSQELLNYVEAFKQSGGKITELSTQIQSAIQALYSQGMSGKFTPPDFSAYDLEVEKWKQRVTDLKAQVDHYHNLQDQLSRYTSAGATSSNAVNVDTSKSQSEVDALKSKTKELGTELQNVSKVQITPENISTLLITLDNILKSIQQISVAFGTIDSNSNIPNLLSSIQQLKQDVSTVSQEMKALSGAFSEKNLNITGLSGSVNGQENSIKSITDLKNSLSGFDPSVLANISTLLQSLSIDSSVAENMQKLSNAILNLKGNLNNVSMSGMDFLNSIKEIVSAGDALNNLVIALDATKEKLDAARQAAKDVSGAASQKGTKGEKKDTGASKNAQDIKAVADAYKELISSEEKYQTLKAKADNKTITDKESQTLNALINQRKDANAVIEENIKLIEKEASIQKQRDAYKTAIDKGQKTYNQVVNSGHMANTAATIDEANRINDALTRTQQLMDKVFNTKQNIAGFQGVFDEAKRTIEGLNKSLMKGTIDPASYTNQINEQILKLNNTVKVVPKTLLPDEARAQMRDYFNTISNGTAVIRRFSDQGRSLTAQMNDQTGVVRTYKLTWDQAAGTFRMVQTQERATTSALMSFTDGLKARMRSLAQYLMTFASFYRIWAMIKKGVSYIKEFDTALTTMKQVSSESEQSLRSFQNASFDIANTVGTTASVIQKSTVDWLRLGESFDQAAESAKAASMLLNVSDFESIDEATKSLVSMSAAYGDLTKTDIIDKLSYVGNHYSISTQELAVAMQASASALTTAGNDMDQAAAIITAGNAVVQDASKVGSGVRTIALRITGTKEAKDELEELGEDTEDFVVRTASKTQETIKSFTKVASNDYKGFDILDENGNYKSTYEILLGIAEIYDEILEADKKYGSNMANGLLETLAGKNRSNIAASILQNKELLASVYDSSVSEAAGSAEEANDIYLESIEGKTQRFTNEVQEFWSNFISTDTVKGVIDGATKIIDVIGKITSALGELGTVLAAVGTAYVYNLIKVTSGGRTKKFVLIV